MQTEQNVVFFEAVIFKVAHAGNLGGVRFVGRVVQRKCGSLC